MLIEKNRVEWPSPGKYESKILKSMNEMLELSENFHPMNRKELQETHGGIWLVVLAGLLIAGGAEIIRDWDNFKAGLRGLPEIK